MKMSVLPEHPLPPAIRTYLSALAARRAKLALLHAMGRSLAMSLALVWVACLLDRLFQLPAMVRASLLIIHVVMVGSILTGPLWRWRNGHVDLVATSNLAERLDPSLDGRLATATSRVLGPSSYRGSTTLLDEVVNDASTRVDAGRVLQLLPNKLVMVPFVAAAVMLLLMLAMLPISWLGLPKLIARYAVPMSNLAPVTTTRLVVTPGSTTVAQGQPLMVTVKAERLGDALPGIHVSNSEASWSRVAMTPASDGFIYRFDPLSRDVQYFITGGDARTQTFDVAVLRSPLVSEFRLRYVYPSYTGRQPLTVTNKTGLIEAPAGTEAVLTVVSTEPLSGGAILVGDQSIELTRTLDGHSRQATIKVERDATYGISLTSERGAKLEPTAKYAIRALPDRPPLVRVQDAAGGQRPGPRDLLPVAYQAMDDYGLDELAVLAKVNGGAPLRIGLKLRGDRRAQEEIYPLDLAPLNLNVGDVLSVTIEAKDGRGQKSASSAMTALVSPRAIDLNAHQRVVELEAARSIADSLVSKWEGAQKAFEAATAQTPRGLRYVAEVAETNRNIVGAGETAAILRQSLLRTTLRSRSHEMSLALADLLDGAQQQLNQSEGLVGVRSGNDEAQKQVTDSLAAARQMRETLTVLATGERAAAIEAERENIAAAKARAADPAYPEVLKQGVARMEDDFSKTLRTLGIDPGAGDIADQLKRKVDAADTLMQKAKMVDFAAASSPWAREIAVPHRPTKFDGRLSTAAQAEAIRPDADLLRARDLQVSSEAATRIEADNAPPTTQATDPLPRELYPASLLALQRYHETNRPMLERPSSDEVESRKRVAEEGRRRMTYWSGLDEVVGRVETDASYVDASMEVEMLAMEASAAAMVGDYRTASRLDRQLAQMTNSRPHEQSASAQSSLQARAERTMAVAENLDKLAAEQQALAEETKLSQPASANTLADKQSKLTDAIAQVQRETQLDTRTADDPDWREEATAAMQAAQVELAAMPQALSATIRADLLRVEAANQVTRIRQTATTAPVELQPAMERSAMQGEEDLKTARIAVTTAAERVQPVVAERMAARLGKFAPPTKRSVTAIEHRLLPALRSVSQAIGASDATGLERATKATLRAIEVVQTELARAQDALIERDPLVAAKWFAKAAVQALKETPPDLPAAERNQRVASVALAKAWDRSIRQAANERLAGVPSMMSVFSFFPLSAEADGLGTGSEAARRIMSLVPAVREWGRVRAEVGGGPTGAVRRDVDPPGYEEPIRLYFEALGKMKEPAK